MTLDFRYGLFYKGFTYGWLDKQLYRLPSESKNKHYTLKKLKKIKVGNQDGYRLKRDKLSVKQLEEKTITSDIQIEKIVDSDVPFNA